MLTLVVASGKGGTGKTTVAVNLALALAGRPVEVQLLDCDVEEPNAHLFLRPAITSKVDCGIMVPEISLEKCSFCGLCAQRCAFNALTVFTDQVMILPELCHGCGSCAYFCPNKAIIEIMRPIGVVEAGSAKGIYFAHGRLNPGEALSPPLIDAVRKLDDADKYTIIDAPPGTACPAVAAQKGAGFCLLVTEPTPFGLSDLNVAVQVARKLNLPVGVVINRCDQGDDETDRYCAREKLPVLLKIPFDRELALLYARGDAIGMVKPDWLERFKGLWAKIEKAWKEAQAL